jgi:hypothetical protein
LKLRLQWLLQSNNLLLLLISLLLLPTNPPLLLQISPHQPSNIWSLYEKAGLGRLFRF